MAIAPSMNWDCKSAYSECRFRGFHMGWKPFDLPERGGANMYRAWFFTGTTE